MSVKAIFPITGASTLHKHILLAAKALQTYIKDFEKIFERVPDERGLTDQLLYNLHKRLVVSTEGAGIKIETTGRAESVNGADYILRFSTRNQETGAVENREIWIQAKSWKDGEALFTQKVTKVDQGTKLQMDLLQAAVTKAQRDDVIVYGGYLVYGTSGESDGDTMEDIDEGAAKERENPSFVDGIDFFPVEDVVKKYKEVAGTKAYIKALNAHFWKSRGEMEYTLIKLIDWKPPKK